MTRIEVKILKATLNKSKLQYAKDAIDYINTLEKQLNISTVSKSFCRCKKPSYNYPEMVWCELCRLEIKN